MKTAKLSILAIVAVLSLSGVAFADEGKKWHRENVVPYPLIHASAHGDVAEVNRLLDGGANPNAANNGGWTALMTAANNGHAEVVKILLAAKANPNAKDKKGRSVWKKATVNGHGDVAKILVAAGAKPDSVLCNPLVEDCLARITGIPTQKETPKRKPAAQQNSDLPKIMEVADCKLVVWPKGDAYGNNFVLKKDGDKVLTAKGSLSATDVDLMTIYCPGIAIRLNQLLKR